MDKTTWIKNADWVAAWAAANGRHVYKRNCDVVFQGDAITFVDKGYDGHADETIDGGALFVMPGLIDIHAHPHHEPAYKGIREEHGVAEMYMTGLYERSLAFELDEEGCRAGAEVAYAELLASGVTTLADLSSDFDGWFDLLARSGLRGYVAPFYASARWHLESRHELKFKWDEKAGRDGFDEALRLIDRAEQHSSGRLSGLVYPAQIETCTEDLLRDSAAAARDAGRPVTTHISQSVMEFNEIVRRHGKTPVQWADEIGLLGPSTILGHCIFIDEHSSLRWHTARDVGLLAESGTSIAHCPSPFARYGDALEDFGRYLRAGVNLGMGTDVSPHNLIEEMRLALILSHIVTKDIHATSTSDLFHAATVGGVKALLRDDLGRLAPGMKADIVLVDLADVGMMPARDPLKSLIYTAADRAVCDVFVDGIQVVADRKVLNLDRADAAGRLQEAQARMIEAVPEHDYAGRSAGEIAPLSLRSPDAAIGAYPGSPPRHPSPIKGEGVERGFPQCNPLPPCGRGLGRGHSVSKQIHDKPPQRTMSDPEVYDVYAIRYALRPNRMPREAYLAKSWSDDPHDMALPVAYYVWAIVNENRTVVVDTGFDQAELDRRRAGSADQWRPELAFSPAEGLARLGIDARQVKDVIVTHLHFDHAGTLEDFPEAAFHVQELEMAYATGRHMCQGYLGHAYTADHVVVILRRLFEGRVRFVGGEAEFAPGITLHLIGGHTMGMQSVRVLTKRGWVVLASDASHFYLNFEGMEPYPIVYNVGEMLRGHQTLKRLAESPRHIIPGHDPLVMARYPAPSDALRDAVVRLDVAPSE